jgi:hypothetical protein
MDEPAVFVPLAARAPSQVLRSLDVLGRLAPGFTSAGAREELDPILERELKSEGVQPEDTAAVTNLREEQRILPRAFFRSSQGRLRSCFSSLVSTLPDCCWLAADSVLSEFAQQMASHDLCEALIENHFRRRAHCANNSNL